MGYRAIVFTCGLWLVFGFLELAGQEQRKPPENQPSTESTECKPITRWGVKGCEILPNGSCPKGYTRQAACPPDPRMKAPCALICVPAPKKDAPNSPGQKPER